FEVWGSGVAMREFLHSDDLANAAIFLLNLPEASFHQLLHCPISGPVVNIGYGKDLTIRDLVTLLCDIVQYQGEVQWDTSKPDGTLRKLLNTEKINATGWQPSLNFADELKKIYRDKFLK
ncbi:MAG TPA: GDP-fucose synthetase, partial [Legionella sp.]|nr:GDP-fucose synthetase [Legionella sp.]